MRNDIFRTVMQEQLDLNTEASAVAAMLIKSLADELCEAWKIAAVYSDEADDKYCDRYYNRSYLFSDDGSSAELLFRPAREWCSALGGMDGPTATNPEDCPLDLVTRFEFFAKHSNAASQ